MSKFIEVLVFAVDEQRYGLPIADVEELVRAASLVSLPKAPPIVEGVFNLRGRIVPVINLRARFGFPAKSLTHTEHFVIAHAKEQKVAIRADQAIEITNVQLEDANDFLKDVEYIAGIAKLADGLLLIQDLRKFLTEEESVAINQALATSSMAGINQ